jgi:anti-anti-sigma regulatory factor
VIVIVSMESRPTTRQTRITADGDASPAALADALQAALWLRGKDVVLDLRALPRVDAQMAAVLLRADRQLTRRRCSLRVVGPADREHGVPQGAGLLGHLPLYDDLPSAGWIDE